MWPRANIHGIKDVTDSTCHLKFPSLDFEITVSHACDQKKTEAEWNPSFKTIQLNPKLATDADDTAAMQPCMLTVAEHIGQQL